MPQYNRSPLFLTAFLMLSLTRIIACFILSFFRTGLITRISKTESSAIAGMNGFCFTRALYKASLEFLSKLLGNPTTDITGYFCFGSATLSAGMPDATNWSLSFSLADCEGKTNT